MKAIAYIIVLLLSVVSGLWLRQKSGFIHFEYQDLIVEMPFWLGLIAIAILVIILITLIDLCKSLSNLPGNIHSYFSKRRKFLALKNSEMALLDMLNENWQRSYKFASKAIRQDKDTILSNFIAAKSANCMGNYKLRDSHLDKVKNISSQERLNLELMRAQLELDLGNNLKTCRLLELLEKDFGYQTSIYAIKAKAYEASKQWRLLKELLPKLKKKNILTNQQYLITSKMVYKSLLEEYIAENLTTKIDSLWSNIPNQLKQDPNILLVYVKYLISENLFETADKELRSALKKTTNKELLLFLAEVKDNNTQATQDRIKFLEKILQKQPKNPHILLVLGKICAKAKLWGKANDYLTASLGLEPLTATYLELASLAELLDDKDGASKYYKEGFLLSLRLPPPPNY